MSVYLDPDLTVPVACGKITFHVRPISCGRAAAMWRIIDDYREETDHSKVNEGRVKLMKLFVDRVEGTNLTMEELIEHVISPEQHRDLIAEFRGLTPEDKKKSLSSPDNAPASSAATVAGQESASTRPTNSAHCTSTVTDAAAMTPHVPTVTATV